VNALPQVLIEDTDFTCSDITGSALDQILVHLRTNVSDLEDTTSPKLSLTEPEGQFDEGKIHRVDPDFGSTLPASNRVSQSNCWVNWKIMGQPCEFQVLVK
jgi:hypothetical protein